MKNLLTRKCQTSLTDAKRRNKMNTRAIDIWPEIFQTENLEGMSNPELCADALMAWGHCHMGNKPPESFGRVLAQVGKRLDISPTDEELIKWSKENLEI